MHDQINYIKELSKQANVKSHFRRQQQEYISDINMALYIELSDIQKQHIFDIINLSLREDFVVNFYGFRMDLNDDEKQKLYKFFIREMDSLLRSENKKRYSVLFFDTSSENKNSFDILKEMYKRVPAIYFAKLNKIYHIKPGFLTKSFGFITFSSWSKLFQKHIEFVQNIQDVQKLQQLKIYNILFKCPKEITKNIKLNLQTPKVIKSAFLGTMRPKPFDYLKKEFKQYVLDHQRGVPLILSILIQTMKKDLDCCFIEGIFRIAGSIEDQQQILKNIQDSYTFNLLDSHQHCKRAISGVIKKIFTQSTTPLVPFSIYNQIINLKIDQQSLVHCWKQILAQLPQLNRRILCYLTDFLRQYILKNKQKNKMTAYNLSVVFNPCLFRSKQCSLTDLIHSGKFAALYKGFLQKYENIVDKEDSQTLNEWQQFQQEEKQKERYRKNAVQINYRRGLRSQNEQFFKN